MADDESRPALTRAEDTRPIIERTLQEGGFAQAIDGVREVFKHSGGDRTGETNPGRAATISGFNVEEDRLQLLDFSTDPKLSGDRFDNVAAILKAYNIELKGSDGKPLSERELGNLTYSYSGGGGPMGDMQTITIKKANFLS